MARSLPDKYYGAEGIHRVPLWRVAGFALNNTATNIYMFMMGYVAYYFQGFLGIATVAASSIAMFMRIWDGVTDPLIGMAVDKTDGKFGKNRPFMVIGQVILCVMSFIMFHWIAYIPAEGLRFPAFLVCEALYYIGYTFQCVVTKSAQTALTNDPKQRPLFTMFDGVYNTALFAVMAVVVTNISGLEKNTVKLADGTIDALNSGFFNQGTWNDMWLICAGLSALFTIIAVISIAPKDRTEFYGIGEVQKVTLKDYWNTIKGNRALQMLIVSASSDKLATSMRTSTVYVAMFALLAGTYSIYGTLTGMTTIPSAILCMVCVGGLATTLGQRKAMLLGSWGGIILNLLMIALWWFGDPTTMANIAADGSATLNMGFFTIAYIILTVAIAGVQGVSGNIVIPMTADCADYEVYRTRKYVPGMMGTLFSLVDKLISSFAPLITGIVFAAIGFTQIMPDRNANLQQIIADGNQYAGQLINVDMIKPACLFLAFGTVIIGLLFNVVALKFYPLTKEYMESIQAEIAEIKANAAKKN